MFCALSCIDWFVFRVGYGGGRGGGYSGGECDHRRYRVIDPLTNPQAKVATVEEATVVAKVRPQSSVVCQARCRVVHCLT